MTDAASERLDTLYQAEFGEPVELALRHGIVILVTGLMLFVTADRFFAIWGGVYFLLVLAFWLIVRPDGRSSAGKLRLQTARILYFVCVSVFYLGPIYTLSLGRPVFLFAGAYALVGTALFLIQRPDPGPDAVWLDSMSFAFGGVGSFIAVQPQLGGLAEQMVAGAICAATVVYFFKASIGRYRRNRARREAERRYARALKARALGQFVGGVAHDFNNLLTAIIGHLELHDVLEDPAERAAALRQSRGAAQRAAMTVKQLLASSGRTRLTPRQTELGEFIERLHGVLADMLEPGIRVELARPDAQLFTKVDREMLETCVIQLCLNAQDALRGKGRIRIEATHVTYQPESDPPLHGVPPYVAILVEDDGPGVPPEALSKLAEPFYTTKEVGEGSGLGLSAVEGFARQSGGGLYLENGSSGLRAFILLPATRG